MPRRASKQNRNGAKNSTGTESLRLAIKDFSVYDYSRSSKDSPQNNLRTTSKLTRECKTLLDEQDWYEKDLSDFDDPQLSDEEHEVQQEIIRSKYKQPTKHRSSIDNNSDGIDYPIDLWFIIAMYISPEDIGKFSLICRTSNHVINTVYFWMRLFRKHNKIEANKISRILVHEHLSIIRTHVIKSLYQVYPLFQDRLNKTDTIQKDPHFLRSSRCVRIWYSKGLETTTQRESYNYYFEFRFDNIKQSKQQQQIQIQALSPILQTNNQYIIDKDCCILHLICSNFVPIGPYMGMILSQITLNVSSDYRYHKLRMLFDSSRLCLQTSKKYNDSVVIIDPILCLKVYNWYNSPASFD
ncbi:unnamed protein product [Adineta steineri]|uniref:F-box domain-containing protein n=1 Tax=Adineta steineri TaxID=433720 RepID=A0A813Q238_9BILA|nr:unnamed protein product [Adineta steineri]CAF0760960.1 unnamed protein product [Adineta steineri]CAF0769684.1 unnamed protein product [Adineta steineri]CAF0769922.1 unnamed protein product [Adineta steineri]CAF0772564.1 unnamed protein product [Adineta steineri]